MKKEEKKQVCVCVCVSSPEPSVRSAVPESQTRVPEQAVAEGRGQICVPQLFMIFPLHLFSITVAHSTRQSSRTTVARSKETPLLTPSDARMIPLFSLYNVCKYHLNVRLALESETGSCADS